MDKTKSDWFREFADAMEADPEGWWRVFQWHDEMDWRASESSSELLWAFDNERPIRRRPRTVTRFDRNGEAVELPELAESGTRYWPDLSFRAHNPSDADKWAEYLRSLLEGKADD